MGYTAWTGSHMAVEFGGAIGRRAQGIKKGL